MRGCNTMMALAMIVALDMPSPGANVEVMPNKPDKRTLPPMRLNGGSGETSALDLVRLAKKNARRKKRRR